jgi:hypothetical protein
MDINRVLDRINSLVEEINKHKAWADPSQLEPLIAQAKALENKHHADTWDSAIYAHEDRGHVISRSICDFDDYYEQKYNK